jgi:peptidoglycan/LPS O-acetylase OafA/YrhL
MFIVGLGAVFFGLTIGWIAYRILRDRSGAPWLSDLIALLGIIAGAAALAFFRNDTIFGWYAIGLVIGFFAYFAVGVILYGKQEVQPWRLEQLSPTSTSDT